MDTVENLHARQIGFRSLTQAIDTTTPGGKLVFHIFGALAEFECSVIGERPTAGLASAGGRGKLGGRPASWNAEDITVAKALLCDLPLPSSKPPSASMLALAYIDVYKRQIP